MLINRLKVRNKHKNNYFDFFYAVMFNSDANNFLAGLVQEC